MDVKPGGSLVLAGTPIGNAGDASSRLKEVLESADIIASEDTRKFRDLTGRLGVLVAGKVTAVHEHNETSRAQELLDQIELGKLVVLVTDAGMPAVSDPGYRIVEAAAARGIHVTCVPGPSAVLTAIAVSGLPSDRFTFEGFLPRKPGDRRRRLESLAVDSRTMVFFEAPHRVLEVVEALSSTFGDTRRAAVCRELTKTFEEIMRGTLGDLHTKLRQRSAEPGGIRGEFAVVVEGTTAIAGQVTPALFDAVIREVAQGSKLKEAVAAVAESAGVSKRELYNAYLTR